MTSERRGFMKSVSATAVGVVTASAMLRLSDVSAAQRRSESPENESGPVFNLGLAAYSFKPHFKFNKGKPQQPQRGKSIDMFQFIDYCARQQCSAELTSYFFPPDADQKYFQSIKRHAFKNGVTISGTAIGNNFTIGRGAELDQQISDAKRWIQRADQMGARHIRFFAGKRKELEAAPETMEIAIESLQQCVDCAAKYGIFVGVENHGKLTPQHLIEIVNGVQSDWFGVNLDTGNFESKDPYADLVKVAPLAVNVQVKVKMIDENGNKYDADLGRVAQIFKDANYRGNIVMEYEEENSFDNIPLAMDELRRHFKS
jgi:sugar phosphate isomerase/epimerase